jgi:tetratricopeptide (TPR) repeat protein
VTAFDSTPDFDDVLAECLAAIESDGSAAIDATCAAYPALADRLRRRIGLLAAADLVDLGPSLDRLPPRLGDFEPLERLGSGGMGAVHRARQVSTGRDVAIKLIRPDQLVFGEARARFRREVELSARLHHPGILPVIAVGETAGLPWFAMELVRGGSLATLLAALRTRHGLPAAIDPAALPALLSELAPPALRDAPSAAAPRSWREWALATARDVARALAHAHGKGVLHRDLKPSNVLVASDGRVFLTDFGLAADPGDGSWTRSRAAVGSLAYMAPEVLSGEPADVRSDVWGVGAVLYELLTLQRPFGAEPGPLLVRAILDAAPTPPRRLLPGLRADDEAVVLRALARDPARRYATAHELALDLENALAGRPTRARPIGFVGRVAGAVRRRPAVSAAVVFGALALLGTPSALWWAQTRARHRLETINANLTAERDRADRNLERAAHAVEVMLERTGANLLDEVPMMHRVRRSLLDDAQRILAELAPQGPATPRSIWHATTVDLASGQVFNDEEERTAARAVLERGLARLAGCAECEAIDAPRTRELRARLLMQLGRATAPDDLVRAMEIYREVLALPTDGAGSQLHSARLVAHMALGELLSDRGAAAESAALLDAALAELPAYEAAAPPSEVLHMRAKLLSTRGLHFHLAHRNEEARADLEAALVDLDRLRELEPESLRPRSDSVTVRANLAAVQMQLGDFEAAEATLARARADAGKLVELFPEVLRFRVELAGVLINIGLLCSNRGDREGCLDAWIQAADQGRALAAHPAPDRLAVYQAGLALGNLASLRHDDGAHQEAIALSQEAEPVLRRVLALAPGDVSAARALEFALLTRAHSALALEDLALARRSVGAARAAAPADPVAQRALVDAWLSLAHACAGGEREDYLERALADLSRAVELGWNKADDLQNNPEFAPLRERPGFPVLR